MAADIYWIVVTGMPDSGQTTFLNTAAERSTYRDRRDMSVISKQDYTDARNAMRIWSARYLQTGEEGDAEERYLIDRYQNSLLVGELTIEAGMYVCLYESPPSNRFDASWEVLEQGLLGIVMLMDSAAPETFKDVPRVIDTITESDVPFVVAANKQDLPHAVPADDLRVLLDMGNTPVIPCVANDRKSVKAVLLALLERLQEQDNSASV
ncbi:MAG: ADP-ribosylation factor-like protein [Chloroflexota bacterium]